MPVAAYSISDPGAETINRMLVYLSADGSSVGVAVRDGRACFVADMPRGLLEAEIQAVLQLLDSNSSLN